MTAAVTGSNPVSPARKYKAMVYGARLRGPSKGRLEFDSLVALPKTFKIVKAERKHIAVQCP